MKKNTMSRIALAAIALLVSGTFAMAADYGDISQNDSSSGEGSTASNAMAGPIVDIDQDGLGGGGRRTLRKPQPKPKEDPEEEEDKSDRFFGICLNFPILGQTICWEG